MQTFNDLYPESLYTRKISQLSLDQLTNIDKYLQVLLEKDSSLINKTHFFHDRHENIYLKVIENDELQHLISECVLNAANILNLNGDDLSIGYWFNLMQPGHVTTLHRHDDDDELLSAVIYLTVPEDSGNLILKTPDQDISLKPVTGNYIYFDPKTPHSVSVNESNTHRLSIGMNFGKKKHQ